MGKSFVITGYNTGYNGICKCDNPKIVIRGYTKIRKQPIYYCYNCGHRFKSSSKKWKELTVRR